jgi:hypothetical protein
MAETQADVANYQNDHDLLVGLTRDVKHLSEDVGKLSEAVAKKNDDHEGRIRLVESKVDTQESSARTTRYILGFIIPVIIAMLGWIYVQDFTFQSTIDARITRTINTALTNYSLIKN